MLDPDVIAATLADLGQPAYRARQVYEALTRGLVTDFAVVTHAAAAAAKGAV